MQMHEASAAHGWHVRRTLIYMVISGRMPATGLKTAIHRTAIRN